MSTCRLCKGFELRDGLIRYGARHNVHAACAISRWGAQIVDKIPPYSLGKLPYKALQDAGLLDMVRSKVEEWEQACAKRDAELMAAIAARKQERGE